MRISVPTRRRATALLAGLAVAAFGAAAGTAAASPKAVYTSTNSPAGNAVVAFDRSTDGSLDPAGSFATSGTGTGGGLGNQGAVTLSDDGRELYAVNAGSDEITAFDVTSHGLRRTDVVGSSGDQPTSVTTHGRLLYVLNAGSDQITGFVIGGDGTLTPLPGSTRALSGSATGPAEVEFDRGGDLLAVTEKDTGKIDTYTVGRDGRPSAPNVQTSTGQTPFGFSFTKRDRLIVSEAFGGAPGASAVSSYDVDPFGGIAPISPSTPTGQTAACWIVVTANGRFTYTTNTGSNNISAYRIAPDGSLSLLDGGVSATTGAAPTDLALSDGSRHLFALNSGAGTVSAFRVQHDGGLAPVDVAGALPAGATGLAAS
jgi:6-phosphogluconolactonase